MTKKINKSWALTISTFVIGIILPLLNGFLPVENQISEEFANNFIYLVLGIGGLGVANSARKTIAPKLVTPKEEADEIDRSMIPHLGGSGSLLQSNLIKGPKRVSIKQDYPYLWLEPKQMRSYITAVLSDPKGNVIQIEQTGTKTNPWREIVRLELTKVQNGKTVPMQRGTYTVVLRGDRGGESQTITQKFDII